MFEMLDVSMFFSDFFVMDNLIGWISILLLLLVCNIIVCSNSKFYIFLKLKLCDIGKKECYMYVWGMVMYYILYNIIYII